MNEKMIIAKKIKEFRELAGIKNQTTLGVLAFGYSSKEKNSAQQKIKRFESGTQEPKASELGKIASLLQVRISDFFIDWTDPRAVQRLKNLKKSMKFKHIE